MARANRHYLPGYVRHITHRCHKREFFLRAGAPYVSFFETENEDIGLDNGVYWNNYPEILNG